jgi:fructose-1,6-bisphosphatase/inositol monophosphatase family enzyme
MMIAPKEFVQAMTLPVRQAMAAVRWLEGRVSNTPKPGQATSAKAALTDADCVSQEILLTALWDRFPGVAVDAEEDTPTVERFAANDSPQIVRVDPVDGTVRFLRRDGLYAIIVGLELEDRVDAALIAVPQEDVLLRVVRGGGVEMSEGGAPFAPARLDPAGKRLLISHGVPDPVEERLRAMGLTLTLAAGGAIGVAPLLPGTLGALRISGQPEGLSRRAWIAALPVLEAGGAVEALDGPFPERYQQGVRGTIVASTPAQVDELRVVVA